MNRSLLQPLVNVFDHRFTRHVVFRTVARCDGFALFQATRNEDFNRHLLWPAPSEEMDIFVQVDKLVREHKLGNALILSLGEKTSGKWLGLVRIQPYKDGVELGLYLHPDTWSSWVIQSAGRTLIQTIHDKLPGVPFYIRVRPGNTKMERICAQYFEPAGQVIDTHAVEGDIELNLYRFRPDVWDTYEKIQTY